MREIAALRVMTVGARETRLCNADTRPDNENGVEERGASAWSEGDATRFSFSFPGVGERGDSDVRSASSEL